MKSKCKGRNKNGSPCRNYPVGDTQYCRQHFPLELINKKTNRSVKIPNSVFWFVVGALGEAVISDVFDYVKHRLGYEFIIPPIKSTDDNSSSVTPINLPTVSATLTHLETPAPTPESPPTHLSTPTPTDVHQPPKNNDGLLPGDSSNIFSNLDNSIHSSSDIYSDIPDNPNPPLTPQVGAQEASSNNQDTKFGIATSGATIFSVLPASIPFSNDDYTPPYIPPPDTDYTGADGFSDDRKERVYMDEQALTPLIGSRTSNDTHNDSTGYFDTLDDVLFLAFVFSIIIFFIYIIGFENTKHAK